MFDAKEVAPLLQKRIGYALNDESFQSDLIEEGEALWFLYEIAPASLGQYQYAEICEQLGLEPFDDYEVDTGSFDEELKRLLVLAEGFTVYLGYWPEGCFGVILEGQVA